MLLFFSWSAVQASTRINSMLRTARIIKNYASKVKSGSFLAALHTQHIGYVLHSQQYIQYMVLMVQHSFVIHHGKIWHAIRFTPSYKAKSPMMITLARARSHLLARSKIAFVAVKGHERGPDGSSLHQQHMLMYISVFISPFTVCQ